MSKRDSAPETQDNMPRAMAWMILSGISFAMMGALVKLSGDVPLTTKVFFRNLVTMIITLGGFGPLIAGAVFDATGDYDAAFMTFIALIIAGALGMFWLKKSERI